MARTRSPRLILIIGPGLGLGPGVAATSYAGALAAAQVPASATDPT